MTIATEQTHERQLTLAERVICDVLKQYWIDYWYGAQDYEPVKREQIRDELHLSGIKVLCESIGIAHTWYAKLVQQNEPGLDDIYGARRKTMNRCAS